MRGHLPLEVASALTSEIPHSARDYLFENEYVDNPINYVIETAAKLISGQEKGSVVGDFEVTIWLKR
jgi:hypothetical protein